MTDVSIECVGSIQSTAQNSKAAEGSVLLEENNDDQSEMQLKIPCKKDFLFLEELGEGSFSTVYLASQTTTSRRFAVKVCYKKQIIRERKINQVFREKEILRELSTPEHCSPFVIRLYCTFQDEDSLYFVLSLAQKRDLLSRLRKHGGQLNIEQARFVTSELVSALEHIHSLNIVHRDVKPENILIHQNGHILLSDFGCARKFGEKNQEKKCSSTEVVHRHRNGILKTNKDPPPADGPLRKCSFVGTAFYVSPEMLNGDPNVGPPCDFWALGVVLFQLLTKKRPFDDESEYLVYKRILHLQYKFPDNFPSDDARDLIRRLLVVKPEERLGSPELDGPNGIKNHKFFSDIDWLRLMDVKPPDI